MAAKIRRVSATGEQPVRGTRPSATAVRFDPRLWPCLERQVANVFRKAAAATCLCVRGDAHFALTVCGWRREACCRRMCSSVDLVLLLCATQKDRSQFCAMHESMVVSTSGLFAGALGFWKLLDRTYQAASHMAVRVGSARRSHTRHSHSTVLAASPLRDCEYS